MTKEYHVFTTTEPLQEHAFVFEITRDENYLEANELWIVNIVDGRESHVRLNLNELFSQMAKTIGGNVEDKSLPEILEVFDDVLPDDKKLSVQIEICQKTMNSKESTVDQLIYANDIISGLSSEELETMKKNLTNKT